MPFHSLWDPSVEWTFSAYFDDSFNFLEHPQVSSLLPPTLQHFEEIARHKGINVWEPVWSFFRAAEMDLLGADPKSLRIVTLCLHTLCALLLFSWLRTLLSCSSLLRQGVCAAVALVWWIHPLHVEVIGWLSAQGYALALLQTLLSAICLEVGVGKGKAKAGNAALAASLALYVTASLTKAPAVMLAPVLLLRSSFLFSDVDKRGAIAWFQLSSGAALAVLLHTIVHNNAHNSSSFKSPSSLSGLMLAALRGALTVATALSRVGWPLDLRPHYRVPDFFFSDTSYEPQPDAFEVLVQQPTVGLSVFFLLAVSWVVLRPIAFLATSSSSPSSSSPVSSLSEGQSRRLRARALGWMAFLLFWLPCCGLVPHGWQALGGDRYSYIPNAFLSASVASFLVDTIEGSNGERSRWWQSALVILPLLLAFVLLLSSFSSISDESLRAWQTDGHFLRRCVERDPLDSDCHQHLAEWSGQHEKDDEKGIRHRELAMATLPLRDLKDFFNKARTRLLMTPADGRPGCEVVREAVLFAAAHKLWEWLPRINGADAGADSGAGAVVGAGADAGAGDASKAERPSKAPVAHLGMLLANACVCDAAVGRETAALPIRAIRTDPTEAKGQGQGQAQTQGQEQGQEESKAVLISAVLERLKEEDGPSGLVATLRLHRERQSVLLQKGGGEVELGPLEASFFW